MGDFDICVRCGRWRTYHSAKNRPLDEHKRFRGYRCSLRDCPGFIRKRFIDDDQMHDPPDESQGQQMG